ncbi:MAG: response regulator [Agathobacter sp.]|nr:response regulator [Agathobacter sp.]
MDRKLTVLIIEDDQDACAKLRDCIEESLHLKFQNCTNQSQEGLDLVKSGLPDVVILDLELHMGGGNGLIFLAELKKTELSHKPYILVTTNNSSNITYEQARNLGADFIMSKHEKHYSPEGVVEFLEIMQETILSTNKASETSVVVSEDARRQKYIQRIQRELDFIGISPKAVGYQYLTDAILLNYQDPQPNLCRQLSVKYRKTDTSIERAMQNAINRAWRISDPDDLLEHYTARIRSDKGVPTLMEFVCYYANILKQDMS